MKLVLLSGGSGKRLWPLSNDARSKQFLRVLEDENNLKASMVERVWSQLKENGLLESTIVATSKSQVDIIGNQLGQSVPLIVEPERRDTFPAIALASTYLFSVEEVSLDEVIAVLPVDPFVDGAFFNRVKDLEFHIKDTDAELGLIGVEPTYPSSKYGYIISEQNEDNEVINVNSFQEKPVEEDAKILLEKKALWNTGVFAFKLRYIIDILKLKGFSTDYRTLISEYHKLPNISFDYEVVESTKKIIAIPYKGYWKDLGTWNTLTEEMTTSIVGNGFLSSDCTNTHIINELDIPVAVLGTKDMVIAVSPDGILVTDKSSSPRIKELVDNINQRPMFEERRWGSYQVIDFEKYDDGNEMLTKRLSILSGKNISYQYHETRSEVWTVVKGQGEFVLDGKIASVQPGDVLRIPVRSRHCIRAITSMEIIEIQTGTNLVESDNFRILELWKDIEDHCLAVR